MRGEQKGSGEERARHGAWTGWVISHSILPALLAPRPQVLAGWIQGDCDLLHFLGDTRSQAFIAAIPIVERNDKRVI